MIIQVFPMGNGQYSFCLLYTSKRKRFDGKIKHFSFLVKKEDYQMSGYNPYDEQEDFTEEEESQYEKITQK